MRQTVGQTVGQSEWKTDTVETDSGQDVEVTVRQTDRIKGQATDGHEDRQTDS